MDDPADPISKLQSTPQADEIASTTTATSPNSHLHPSNSDSSNTSNLTPNILEDSSSDYLLANSASHPLESPSLSRTNSSTDLDNFLPPVDRLTIFDILENFALPQRLERMQNAIHDNAEKLRKQRQKLTSRALSGKDNIVGKWRKGSVGREGGSEDLALAKYRSRMRASVERISKRWEDLKTVTMKEKISFVSAVLNIFISAYLIGGWPEYFHYWYSIQLAYFMPIRWYKYHSIGYHYFLADLCYFVNLLLVLSIWFFPQSKRLFISTYCLALGNNAVAIAMWRNSLVFHSLDKVTSLFIHIMPCATLHVLVHLLTPQHQLEKFPAIYQIKFSPPSAPEHYSLSQMIIWATLPYAIWQVSYHLLITRRKSSKIAAGRPTSFTYLRRSYSKTFLGKFVLSFPEAWQETVFMCIQYTYAMLTMLPCPIWFWYRWASAGFMMVVFTWASWNGATYYIDVFGRRMEKELEELRREVARLESSGVGSPEMQGQEGAITTALDLGPAAKGDEQINGVSQRQVSEGLTLANGVGGGKKDG